MGETQEPGVGLAQDDQWREAASMTEGAVAARRRTIRWVSWTAAWGIPLVVLIVGIVLTSVGTVQQVDYDTLFIVEVWPAGLVLLAAGLLGLMSVAIANAVRASGR